MCRTGTSLDNLDLVGDIVVPEGELCILVNVTLKKGAVKAVGSVVLIGCDITGDVEMLVATPGTTAELVRTNVTGNTKIVGGSAGAGSLLVREGSSLSSLEASDVSHVRLSDSSVKVMKVIGFSMGVSLQKVSVDDTIELSYGAGEIDLRSTEVGGSLKISECKKCGISTDFQTSLNGGLELKESSGSLSMLGTALAGGAGNIVVTGMDGSVTLDTMFVGGIILEAVSGHIYLAQVFTAGGATLDKCIGSLLADGCGFGGGLKSSSEFFQGLVLKLCSFGKKLVQVEGCAGLVLLEGNYELTVFLSKNNGLTLDGNNIATGTLADNAGGVVLRNNIFQVLICISNSQAPSMEGNIVQEGGRHGQCELSTTTTTTAATTTTP